jgi:hypothetical protein
MRKCVVACWGVSGWLVNGMQGVRGSNPLSSTPGQRPDQGSTLPDSSVSGSKLAAMCAARDTRSSGAAVTLASIAGVISGNPAPSSCCRRPGPSRPRADLPGTQGRSETPGEHPLISALYPVLGPQDRACDLRNDVPLVTAENRSAPRIVAQTWTRHVPLVGAAARRVADLGWQGRPPPAAPDKRAPPGNRLVRGSLAGSGPGTSPCIDGLSLVSGIVVPRRLACSNHAQTVTVLDRGA